MVHQYPIRSSLCLCSMETETPDHEQQHEDQDPISEDKEHNSAQDSWLVRALFTGTHAIECRTYKDMALFGTTVHDKTWCFSTWKFNGNISVNVSLEI